MIIKNYNLKFSLILILIIFIIIFNFCCYKFKNYEIFKNYNLSVNDKLQYPIYWINLDKSTDRHTYMLNQFKKYNIKHHTRINAVDGNNISSNRYIIPKNNLSSGQLGCLLSHINSIKQAYDENKQYALIMEDDICICTVHKWNTTIKNIINETPNNWEIIQLHVVNSSIIQQLIDYKQKYVPWKQKHWSTLCYLINRTGMQKIINLTIKNNKIVLPNNISVADDFIYRNCITYTYTYPLFANKANKSNITEYISSNQINSKKQVLDYYNLTDVEC
jgi:glycosyl transferase family 25